MKLMRSNLGLAKAMAVKQMRSMSSLPAIPMPPCEMKPQSFSVPSLEEVLRIRKTILNPGMLTFYKKPVYITQGSMQWLWDHEGNRYLDLLGGVVTVSVGHCHPKVNAALKEQVDKLWHTTSIYLQPKIHEYAERLAATFPEKLNCVFLVNSGSEANDLAMLMARLYTGNHDFISLRNAYHGAVYSTMGLTAQGPWKFKMPSMEGIHHAMNPDPFRGLFGGQHCRDSPVQTLRSCDCGPDGACRASDAYMDQFEEVFKYSLPKTVAGFFAESIQGSGGTVQFPKGFLAKAFARVRAAGGLCISDEVQTGFGRTGDHFWGFQGHGVVPDIVTMAKGIGNGMPMGAVVTTREIGQVLTGALFFNTFGGNPMASAVGLAVLDAIKEDRLQENCQTTGTYFLNELAKLRDEYEIVGDVRGKGLMIGVEMVADKQSKAPLPAEKVLAIWEDCKDMRVLLGKGGVHGNVFRIKPPMCVTKDDADFTIKVMRAAIEANTK